MASPSDVVALLVNGILYSGWQAVRITRSMDALAGSFELSLTDVWAPGEEPWPLVVGDACTVAIGTDTVITGWVDEVEALLDGTQHTLTVKGRDKTCDIVDCSATNRPGEWRGKKIEAIAAEICAPYGVKVVCDVDTGPAISLFRLQPGEKCMDALERLCKGSKSLLILTGTPAGDVHITTASTLQIAPSNGGVSLIEGVNIKSIRHNQNGTEQFHTYIVEAFAKDQKDSTSSTDDADPQGGSSLERF
jgi:prophage tail gpP-like protein